ncbi:WAP four-disulfide core domain protein 3-like isoform X1 [Bufo gargarizans]|uniref:WAP four-disulfide core domain protein 3-like isoform X1 n=1 Tax=Bufo gargarizans TaxID=30331 RepID=UPI001CF2149F|nr:WAP four-disulfide core domain protein 3-like isoform X1 [Bufo gargarizans]
MAPATNSIILLLLFYGGNVSSQSDLVPITDDGVKPGTCPVFNNLDLCDEKIYKPLCSGDKDCPLDQKCCEQSCGRVMCSIPIPRVKPGKCPEWTLTEICPKMLPFPPCSADDQCPDGQKCCKDSCGEVMCTDPIGVKPGKCPEWTLTEICPKMLPFPPCSADDQCPDGQKCCKDSCGEVMCTDPIGVKPGKCPEFTLTEICPKVLPVPRCSADDQCPDGQKCCKESCGAVKCTNPIGVKPGKCPEFTLTEICPKVLPFPPCFADDQCPDGQKCCKDSCGEVKCTNPIAEVKPGLCPPYRRTACTFPLPPPDCYNDQWCLGIQKCCFYSCKMECVNPYISEWPIEIISNNEE